MKYIEEEFDKRAQIYPQGCAAMSMRWPEESRDEVCDNLNQNIIDFIGTKNLQNKKILEVGCGDGRLTKELIGFSNQITCLDCSGKMLEAWKKRFASEPTENVKCVKEYLQNFVTDEQFDMAIISLVLIHNVNDDDYMNLIKKLYDLEIKNVYVFEDVNQDRITVPTTRLRPETEIINRFENVGYKLIKKKDEPFMLFNDKICFLAFER